VDPRSLLRRHHADVAGVDRTEREPDDFRTDHGEFQRHDEYRLRPGGDVHVELFRQLRGGINDDLAAPGDDDIDFRTYDDEYHHNYDDHHEHHDDHDADDEYHFHDDRFDNGPSDELDTASDDDLDCGSHDDAAGYFDDRDRFGRDSRW
jgi:hypothetical protein